MLPNDNILMFVRHLDHVTSVYSSMEHVTWKSGHVLHQAVNSQDMTKMSDGHRKCLTDIETSLDNILQLCRVRSFYITVYTNRMNLFNTCWSVFRSFRISFFKRSVDVCGVHIMSMKLFLIMSLMTLVIKNGGAMCCEVSVIKTYHCSYVLKH